jgi:hypothetical protein
MVFSSQPPYRWTPVRVKEFAPDSAEKEFSR